MKAYQLGLYEKAFPNELSLSEKLSETGIAGFDFMELSIDESEEKQKRLRWTREDRKNLVNAMWLTNIKIKTMCLSGNRKYPIGSLDKEVRIAGVKLMNHAIELASDLGIRIIQVAGYDEYYNPSTERTRDYFLSNIRKITETASKNGVILAFETMETEFMNTVEKALQVVKDVNSPYLQIYPDIGNITNAAIKYGTSPLDDLGKGHGHIVAVHMKETIPGVFREVPFGSGHVNFAEAFDKCKSLGNNIFVAEFWHTSGSDWRHEIKAVNKFMRSKI